MSRVDPKQAAIFVIVLLVIASFINGTQESGQQAVSNQTVTQQPVPQPQPQPQQQIPVQNEVVSPKNNEHAVVASRRTVERAASASRKAAVDPATERANYLARYLNPGFAPKPGTKSLALVVVSENGEYNTAVRNAIAARIKSGTMETIADLFTPQFVSDGLFTDTFGGSRVALGKLELMNSLDGFLLARQKVQYSTNPSLNNVITANMRLEVMIVPVAKSGPDRTHTFTAYGAGFKPGDARSMAEERLIKQIAGDTKIFSDQIFPHVQ